jgi:glycosyltransferase involved in cell wall biosynthesis
VYVDNDSDDGTADIARAEGADVRAYDGGSAGLDDRIFVAFANATYKEAVGLADWVIWSDADELLYAPDMLQRLEHFHYTGVTLPHVNYYVMTSPALPVHAGQIYDSPDFRRGLFVQADAKIAIFNPNVLHVHWHAGKHDAAIQGPIIRDSGEQPLKLLHYRWLGEDYLHARDAKNYARLSQTAKFTRYGVHVYPDFVGPYHPMWPGPRPTDAEDVLS